MRETHRMKTMRGEFILDCSGSGGCLVVAEIVKLALAGGIDAGHNLLRIDSPALRARS